MFVDYHIHSNFSRDSRSSILDIVETAIVREMDEIAITDHYEGHDSYDVEGYFATVEKLRQLYGSRIGIKCGLEIGQPHIYEEKSRRILNHNYDFVLASVHEHGGTDYYTMDFRNVSLSEFTRQYLEEMKKVIRFGDFDCLGHLDLLKRYANNYGLEYDIMEQKELLTEVLKLLIVAGKGVEINSSGYRQNMGKMMPDLEVLKLYRELGGEIITVGSDAHQLEHIGMYTKNAMDIAKEAGFRYITIYEKRNPEFISI